MLHVQNATLVVKSNLYYFRYINVHQMMSLFFNRSCSVCQFNIPTFEMNVSTHFSTWADLATCFVRADAHVRSRFQTASSTTSVRRVIRQLNVSVISSHIFMLNTHAYLVSVMLTRYVLFN